jgi:hypothetical protein
MVDGSAPDALGTCAQAAQPGEEFDIFKCGKITFVESTVCVEQFFLNGKVARAENTLRLLDGRGLI